MSFAHTKSHNRGLSIGAAILTAFGLFWALAAVRASASLTHIAAYAAIAIALAVITASIWCAIRAQGREAHDPIAAEREGRRAGMWFGIILTLEGAFIAAAAILLSRHNLANWIPAVTALIVGLHFLPLARLFRAPLYYLTGLFAAAAALASVAITSAPARITFVCASMAAILWLTAVAALVHSRRYSS
jgi:hypothetical protein